eukprot:m.24293 g.24293  ORF g.24293 m.24293 type:complete len:268 (+) comp13044_c0_seq2:266-1069(+)
MILPTNMASLFSGRKGASKHRISKGPAGDVIPGTLAKSIDDVTIMESKAHAMEKALKKYVYSRKEELTKAERLLAAVEDEATIVGISEDGTVSNGRVSEYGTRHINTERNFNQELERTAVNPTKTFCKIFPEVAGVTSAYARAAQDFKKASERHRMAEMKNRDTMKTKVALELSQSEFDRETARLPTAVQTLLEDRYLYFEACLHAAVQVETLHQQETLSVLEEASAAFAEDVQSAGKSQMSGQDELNALLDQIQGISIVGGGRADP